MRVACSSSTTNRQVSYHILCSRSQSSNSFPRQRLRWQHNHHSCFQTWHWPSRTKSKTKASRATDTANNKKVSKRTAPLALTPGVKKKKAGHYQITSKAFVLKGHTRPLKMSGGIYEQLRYLCDLSTGLMCRLHHMKQRYQTKDLRRAPGCMVSSNFANIRRKIERGFSKSNPYILIEKGCRAVVWVCSLPLRDDCIYMIVRFFVIVTSAKGICIIDSFLSVRLHIVRLRLYCVYPRLHLTGQHFRWVFQGSW